MPISKGQPYGAPGPIPGDAVFVRSDAEARRVLEDARRRRVPFPTLGLLGGDLCRTLGGGTGGVGDTEARLRAGEGVVFPVDLGEVLVDGHLRLFVAHLMARSRTWSHVVVAMNAQWHGRWNLGPRAHPGDSLLDTYEARLAVGQRLAVRARLHHGAHLPHPGIVERRVAALQVELGRRLPIWLDGQRVGSASTLALRVEPDAVVAAVA